MNLKKVFIAIFFSCKSFDLEVEESMDGKVLSCFAYLDGVPPLQVLLFYLYLMYYVTMHEFIKKINESLLFFKFSFKDIFQNKNNN